MITLNEEGVYTKTQAYNFLKKLLGVSNSVLIYESFFNLFFSDYEQGTFRIKKTEDVIKKIFTENGIASLNEAYWQKKQGGNSNEAKKIAENVRKIVKESLAA